jgi:hypothetical protein
VRRAIDQTELLVLNFDDTSVKEDPNAQTFDPNLQEYQGTDGLPS